MAEAREIGPGERAERARKRRFRITLGLLFAVGLATGAVIGAAEGKRIAEGGTGFLQASLPAWVAILLTGVYLVSVGVGMFVLSGRMDKHARTEQLWFTTCGASAFLIVYPAWFLLWKGRLLPEPHHLILFGIFYAGALTGYLVRHFRFSR